MYNRGKFHLYSISGCQVKKFEMFLWQWSIHEMDRFWAFLGPNSPKYGLILLKFAPQLVLMGSKTVFEEFFENWNFYRNRTYPKFALFSVFVQLWGCFSPWRRPKSKKLNILQDKTTPSGYPKIAKSRPYLAPIFHEKYDYFLSYFGPFLVKKRAWSHFKVSESNLLQSHNSGACSSQKSLVPELPSFAAIGAKGRFFQFQTTFSSLAAFLGTMPLL